jgi:molecular chaperone GrpE
LTAERDALAAERDALAKERDTAADSLLRLRAEFDNFRRRTSREVIDAEARAQAQVLSDLLPVLDNLDRALEAAEHHEEGKVLDGVRMTRNMFADLLGRAGVEEIGEVGTLFDPNLHEAVLVQSSEQPEGTVAAVLQRGYRQGERILRAARVAVSSGPASTTSPGGTLGHV